jgi:prepilin-type processing-associated H-X9-DG protein
MNCINTLNGRIKPARQEGFTPMELLVVIGTVTVLAMLIYPVFRQAGPPRRGSCLNNMRQIGFGIHMYQTDFGKLPPIPDPQQSFEYDFMCPSAANWPMHVLRPYWSLKDGIKAPRLLYCPAAKPHPSLAYAPGPWTDCNLILSPLVLEKGLNWVRNPGAVILAQEFRFRSNMVLYEPERTGTGWTQWHCWNSLDGPGSGGGEYYDNLHKSGGNLIYVDGHVEYKKSMKLNSLDFGLVDMHGQSSPYQPTTEHSRANYVPAY